MQSIIKPVSENEDDKSHPSDRKTKVSGNVKKHTDRLSSHPTLPATTVTPAHISLQNKEVNSNDHTLRLWYQSTFSDYVSADPDTNINILQMKSNKRLKISFWTFTFRSWQKDLRRSACFLDTWSIKNKKWCPLIGLDIHTEYILNT